MAEGFDVKRRGFFGAVAAGAAGAAAATLPGSAKAQTPPAKPSVAAPSAAQKAAESEPLPAMEATLIKRSGSDYMVDVLKSLKIDYVATMPGSTFRGLHESLVNYGGNKVPELLTCLHEEVAVGMGHGYAKVAHKPMASLIHGVVGMQHGSMAIYNAWADHVPMLVMIGNTLPSEERRPGAEWAHSAQDNAAMIRDFTKWDDAPVSLSHFAESTVRAMQISTAFPQAPVAITVDGSLAEAEIAGEEPAIPKLGRASPPMGDRGALQEAAKMLAAASFPVIVLDRSVRSEAGLANMVALAEALGAAVVDKGGRMNFPSRHPLNQSTRAGAVLRAADVVIGIDANDLFGTINSYKDRIHRVSEPLTKTGVKLISLGTFGTPLRANFQDFQRYQAVDLDIVGDGETSVPVLLEMVRSAVATSTAREDRVKKLGAAWQTEYDRLRQAATYAWDESPIGVSRLVMEIYGAVKHEDWALTAPGTFLSNWASKLWDITKSYQYLGEGGGYGVGYSSVASLGAALAHKDVPGGGRIPVAILGDGDFMCAPSILWTAAHHKIPMLIVMHNNRAYHQEIMHVQRMAARHARPLAGAQIGTAITSPNIDYAMLAKSMGVSAEGPIDDPAKLGPALQRAVALVKSGQPALIDAVCQPR